MVACAEIDFNQKETFWDNLDEHIAKECVDQEFAQPTHPDALECGRQQGTFKTVFERENTTPRHYWPLALFGGSVLTQLPILFIAAVFFVIRWVLRGFRSESP